MAVKVAPSMLSADFSRLGEETKLISESGADYIHLDVMDGHFVPNITFGPQIIKSIRQYSEVPFDCHLMIENVADYIPLFAEAGVDLITVHVEATRHLDRSLQLIKSLGKKAGVVLNPHTPIALIEHVLYLCDLVLVMTVNPGFGGQSFIKAGLNKIKQLAELRETKGFNYLIEVDGGITAETARLCEANGADILVAGSYIFGQTDRQKAIEAIRGK
jgi:ribulose-phosphate 3-epimerase